MVRPQRRCPRSRTLNWPRRADHFLGDIPAESRIPRADLRGMFVVGAARHLAQSAVVGRTISGGGRIFLMVAAALIVLSVRENSVAGVRRYLSPGRTNGNAE